MSLSGIPHLKHCRPARNTAATLHLLQFHTHLCVLLHTYVYCLIWRCSKWSIPDIQEKNLMVHALREFRCKGSSWLLLIPWFCNTYNTYIWGDHNEYIVPFPMFKHYFIWILDVVITVCILVQSPRSKFKQQSRTKVQMQMLDIETKLYMVFYELPLLGMCFCVWNNIVLYLL